MTTANHKPLHIAMLSLHSSPVGPLGTQNTGGMSVYVRELAKWLGEQGHRIDIFTCVDSPGGRHQLYPNVHLIGLLQDKSMVLDKANLPAQIEAVFDAVEQYRRRHQATYDLIHSHYWISAVVGAMARTRWYCPHLVMFHTLGAAKNHAGADENEPLRRIAHERWLAKVADGIIAPSDSECQNLLCHYHPRPDIIHTIPCGVDLNLFKPMDKQAARRAIGLATNTQVALYVGRFAPVKGIGNLIGAAARLKERRPDLHWVLVGGDGLEAQSTVQLKRQVRRQHLENRVTFAGRIDHGLLPLYYGAADFLVIPSFYESFGLVMLEALACGTPVVTAPVGMASAIIREGINGVMAPGPEPKALARAITRLPEVPLGNPDAVRATIRAYSWDNVAAAVMRIYGLLQGADHPIQPNRSASAPKETHQLGKGAHSQ